MADVFLPKKFIAEFLAVFRWCFCYVIEDLLECEDVVADVWRKDCGAAFFAWKNFRAIIGVSSYVEVT